MSNPLDIRKATPRMEVADGLPDGKHPEATVAPAFSCYGDHLGTEGVPFGGALVVKMERKKILIVDDNADALQETGAALEATGYKVVLRSRGEGTVAAVLQERPDLVLLDVNAPRLSGDTIAVILAKTDPDRKTIVLLHSSLSAEMLKLKVLQTGASGFVVKTGNVHDVVAQVNVWMKRRFGANSGTGEPSPASISSTELTSVMASAAPPSGTVRRPTADEPKHPSGAFKRTVPSVLFVDDDTFTLAGYRRMMTREAMSPDFSSTAEEALRKITSSPAPDVVVCDMLMPRKDGIQLFQTAVDRDPSWRHRFIFATGAKSVLYVEKFLSTVNAPILYKPISVDELMRAIRIVTIASTGVERTAPIARPIADES